MHGAGAPSPPSEEGGGFLPHRGKKTEGEIHRGSAKAVGIDEKKSIMISVSFSAHLYLGVISSLALSLPQSRL